MTRVGRFRTVYRRDKRERRFDDLSRKEKSVARYVKIADYSLPEDYKPEEAPVALA